MTPRAWEKIGSTPFNVFIVGDTIWDTWTEVNASRIAPDAPAPVWDTVGKSEFAPGGAANAARQFLHLNANALLTTVCDQRHGDLHEECGVRVLSRFGTVMSKRRIVSHGHVLARLDSAESFKNENPDRRRRTIDDLLEALSEEIAKRPEGPTVALLCDYAQGFWSVDTATQVVSMFQSAGVVVIVDPKPKGVILEAWRGADVIKVNSSEARAFCSNMPGVTDEFAAKRIAQELKTSVVLTRGCQPPLVYDPHAGHGTPFAVGKACAEKTRPVWASGAGDCFAAYFAASIAVSNSVAHSAEIAHAAGIAYTRHPYNLPVNPNEAMEAVNHPEARLHKNLTTLRKRFLQIDHRTTRTGYTSGVFDLFHPGHVESLRFAKEHCDFLVVAVNSDASAKRIKGRAPVMNEYERAAMVASCRDVDAVIVFDEDTPTEVYKALGHVTVIVKGADWKGKDIAGIEYCGSVVYCPESYPVHTTDIRERITHPH